MLKQVDFKNIQLLRAVAAVLVFIFHAVAHYKAMGGASPFILGISTFGYAGVDIFFIISGFVAAHTTLNLDRNVSNGLRFFSRRLLRIYLGYWPFWFLCFIGAWLLNRPLLNHINLTKSFFLSSPDMSLLLIPAAWSLTYELLFYALIAITFGIQKKPLKHGLHLIFLSLLIWLVATFTEIYSFSETFISMLTEFVGGMLLYIYKERLARWPFALIFIAVGSVAFYLGIILHANNNSIRILTFGIAAFSIVVVAVYIEQAKIWQANDFLVGIGDASYTIYLAHLPALDLFYFSHVRDYLAQQNFVIKNCGFALFVFLTIFVCKLIFMKIELPTYKLAILFFLKNSSKKSPMISTH